MKPTLLILAAGMGSRYGGIKQLDSFGPNGETIIDYSLYDAIRSGFGKIVFIIREELKTDFEAIFAPKLKGKIEYEYAIQSVESYIPDSLQGKVKREKPWGTGHAVLCARPQTQTAFAVINADDFYGHEAFSKMGEFLANDTDPALQAMMGYQIKNTLSENGTVSRGICQVDSSENLIDVVERTKIIRQENGKIAFLDEGEPQYLEENTPVSMNFWGFKPEIFPMIHEMFQEYALNNLENPKAEFFIPKIISNLIDKKEGACRVFNNASEWFGVTYPEDKESVIADIAKQIDKGNYPEKLWTV
ncbi:MAG: sugar phosphate nucleotidyltransferase [Leadbetterella sp.]